MWLFSKKKINETLGIDINNDFISIVKLRKNNDEHFELINYGILNTDKEIIQTDRAILEERDVSFMIKEILYKMNELKKINETDVIMSIPHNASFMFNLDMPNIPDQELNEAIKFEARSILPIAPSEAEINWQIISKNDNELKILVIAVPKEIIAQYKNISKKLGFSIKILEIRTFSLIRALGIGSKNTLLVDFNNKNFNISFIKNGLMSMSNSDKFAHKVVDVDKLAIGINNFIESLQEKIEKIALFSTNLDVNSIKSQLSKKIKISIDTMDSCSKIDCKGKLKTDLQEKKYILAPAIGLDMY
ncbi:MAG: pilus assembly protein PilM [Patescibacteria group bacterium]